MLNSKILPVPHTPLNHFVPVNSAVFSPNSQLIASASTDTTIQIRNLAAKEVNTIKGGNKRINTVRSSPDNRLLAFGGYDKTVQLWQLDPLKAFRSVYSC
jgi:WD40 repeat protein